ncbi:hypothetical protein LZC95_49505 [Pendulispora brunnea]|uniref:Cytochrome c domain-containing protein n=1 Tax=Pendulispora brunnea TaxID=2905690 RepID=A0ABZ2K714_9BACT
MRFNRTATGLTLVIFAAGCSAALDEQVDEQSAAARKLYKDVTADSIGKSATVSPSKIDLSFRNPFFHDFGSNGRTCGTCHQEAFGWSITPEFAQSRPVDDELFAFDGSDCLAPGESNPDPELNSTAMLSKALIRVDIGIPATADFTLVGYTDPLHCPTAPSAAGLRMYRRPLPSANTAFLSTVMWDGRENTHPPNNTVDLIESNLATQANDATRGHAQGESDLPDGTPERIVKFETNLFNAQQEVHRLKLDSRQGHGGAEFLYTDTLPNFYIGINDVLNCAIPNSCEPGYTATFTNVVFTLFQEWEKHPPRDRRAAAIARGEAIFNNKSFPIDNVAGLNGPNDTLGVPSPLTGFCGSCHDSPNVGNHSTSLPIDIGLVVPSPVGGLDVSGLPTYTFMETSSGRTVTVTDPGRGLITGKFNDIGKTKGPILRGLATRAPYFHNGSAKDLNAVVRFYDERFHIGFTDQEKDDLVAFLQAL